MLDWTTELSFYHFYLHLTGFYSNLPIGQIAMADLIVLLLCIQMNVTEQKPAYFSHKLKFILLPQILPT